MCQPNPIKRLDDALPALRPGQARVHCERQADDLLDGFAWIEGRIRILEDDLHARAQGGERIGRYRGEIGASEADRAGGRLEQAKGETAERCLSAAAFADQAEAFSGRDGQ